jgi:hypothetical protein
MRVKAGVVEDDAVLLIGDEHRVVGFVDSQREQVQVFAIALFAGDAVGDVVADADHPLGLAVRVEQGRIGGFPPDRAAAAGAPREAAGEEAAIADIAPEGGIFLAVGIFGAQGRGATGRSGPRPGIPWS